MELKLLPSDRAIADQGYDKTLKKIKGIAETLEAINPDKVLAIAREVRRRVYMLGLDGGYEHIQEQADMASRWEQKHIDHIHNGPKMETATQYTERLRKWRTYYAIRALSFFDDYAEKVSGDINARFRKKPQPDRIAEKVFNKEGNDIVMEICDRTPEDILMDIIAFTDDENHRQYETDQRKFTPGLLKAVRRNAQASLIRRYITTDQNFIETACKYFKYYHYEEIMHRSPGALSEGKIGLKAAGMILAYAVLTTAGPECDRQFAADHNMSRTRPGDLKKAEKLLASAEKMTPKERQKNSEEITAARQLIADSEKLGISRLKEVTGDCLEENNSYFIGSTVLKDLISNNSELALLTVAKYHDEEVLEDEKFMKDIENRIMAAKFPPHLLRQLEDFYRSLSMETDGGPIIVRSSSALEDKAGASFAGMYDSFICPSDNFEEFLNAIKAVYVSVFRAKVIKYRKKHGLLDYDESMSLLVQVVNGQWHGQYFLPDLAGVGLSHAPQSPGPDPARGSMTVVLGLGEKVVQSGGKIIWFAQPQLTFGKNSRANYIQDTICVWDKETGSVKYVTPSQLIDQREGGYDSKAARDVFSEDGGVKVQSKLCRGKEYTPDFKGLTENKPAKFPLIMEYLTRKLRESLGYNVDIEFTARKTNDGQYKVKIVQCRPQNIAENLKPAYIPEHVPEERVLLRSGASLSGGHATEIKYVLYIPQEVYGSGDPDSLSHDEMNELRYWIAKVNGQMPERAYMTVAPGRWGDNPQSELGVYVTAGDYDRTAAVVEVTGDLHWKDIPPSAGSHDYQLIVEKGILTLSIKRGCEDAENTDLMRKEMLDNAPNTIKDLPGMSEIPSRIAKWLRLVKSEDIGKSLTGQSAKWRLHIAASNTGKREAVVYLAKEGQSKPKIGDVNNF